MPTTSSVPEPIVKGTHTPGPWHDDGYRIYAPTDASDKRNARVIVEYKHVDDFNSADAHLIAAAPDLLAAAKNLGSVLKGVLAEEVRRGGRHDPECPTCQKLDALDAAIAKAEGR